MQQVLIRSMLVRAVSGFSAPSASSARHMADLVVPAMGDSISEGTVSSVLKKIGESVTMDETLVQIETDKVTIDIKAAEAGFLSSIVVSAGEVVKPGQIIGFVGASVSAPAPPSSSGSVQATSAPAPPSAGSTGWRTPSISFPPRLTATGQRISDLPEGTHVHQSAATAPPPPPPPPRPPTSVTPAPSKAPAKKSPTVYSEPPARRKPTAKEMEFINSGGAW